MSKRILDASAVLMCLNEEIGFERAIALLEDAAISAVNLAEVGSKLTDKGGSDEAVRERLAGLELAVVDFGAELAFRAAALRQSTRHAGLSLGDRACLATAKKLGVPAVTADRTWSKLKLDTPIQVVR